MRIWWEHLKVGICRAFVHRLNPFVEKWCRTCFCIYSPPKRMCIMKCLLKLILVYSSDMYHALIKTTDVKTAIFLVILFVLHAYWCWKHADMKLDGADVSVCAAAAAAAVRSVDSWYHRLMIYFLVSSFCKPRAEQHQRGQRVELRQRHKSQDDALLLCKTKELSSRKETSVCRFSEKRGDKTSAQGLAICDETNEGTKNSQSYNFTAGAACHSGYHFRFKHCASNGGANLNTADKGGGRTGLNLHFILVILFSTNKLKPEKT